MSKLESSQKFLHPPSGELYCTYRLGCEVDNFWCKCDVAAIWTQSAVPAEQIVVFNTLHFYPDLPQHKLSEVHQCTITISFAARSTGPQGDAMWTGSLRVFRITWCSWTDSDNTRKEAVTAPYVVLYVVVNRGQPATRSALPSRNSTAQQCAGRSSSDGASRSSSDSTSFKIRGLRHVLQIDA